MNDERASDSPVEPENAPDHGPDFWTELDRTLQNEAGQQTAQMSGDAAMNATSQMPVLRAVGDGVQQGRVGNHAAADASRTDWFRLKWPAAAAAVAVVVLGLGFLAARGGSDPATTTELVVASSPVDGAAAAEGIGEGGDVESSSTDAIDDASETAGDAALGVADGEVESATGEEADESNEADEPALESDVAPIPDFASARGAVGEPEYVPLDQGIPADGTYLANWPERALTWFAVTDTNATCVDSNYSEIRYVNGSGFTQPVRDPQLRFSGDISHFVVSNELDMAAWVVACGQQLELHIATLDATGRIATPTLVWLGEGSSSAALVQWTPNTVSLNAIEPAGQAFSVEYNIDTQLLSRNGGPSRIMLEAGAPASRSLTPLAASPDGGLTYWQGTATPGTVSQCSELFGSGRSDMLWLRQGEGQWQHAVPVDLAVGSITAAALDSSTLQFAFADVCTNEPGRVVIGTQLPDGRIGDVLTLDLTPFVPGYASQLFWVDDQTLRIETDNSEFGFDTVRFDYRLDEQVMLQLD